MRLGATQKCIVAYMRECKTGCVYIGALVKSPHFDGLSLEQVDRALESLKKRRIVREVRRRFYTLTITDATHA